MFAQHNFQNKIKFEGYFRSYGIIRMITNINIYQCVEINKKNLKLMILKRQVGIDHCYKNQGNKMENMYLPALL